MFFPGQLSQLLYFTIPKRQEISQFFSVFWCHPKRKMSTIFFPTGCNHAQDPKGWYSLNRSHVISNVLKFTRCYKNGSLSLSLSCGVICFSFLAFHNLYFSSPEALNRSWPETNWQKIVMGKRKVLHYKKHLFIWLNFPTNSQCNKCTWSFPNYLLRRKKKGKGDWTTIQI